MIINNALAKSVLYVLIIAITYYFEGYPANYYMGYRQIDISESYLLVLLVMIVFGAYLFGRKYKNPSDFFLILYGMIVIIPYGVLHTIYSSGGDDIWQNIFLIFLPFSSVLVFCSNKLNIPNVTLISQNKLMRLILALSVITVGTLLINPPSTASFSLLDSYTRRLEARDVYGSGTLLAYMSTIVMNSMLPLMVFCGVLQNEFKYILISVLLYVGFYYIYGVKAPIMYILFSCVFAYYSRRYGGLYDFYNTIYYIFVSFFILAWIEFALFGYSYVEDYLIRRVYYVGSYLSATYFDTLSVADFSWIYGLTVDKAASMYIGEDFLGLPGTNANSNTFLYFLLQYGFPGYIFSIMLVTGVLLLLNSLRFKTNVFVFLSLLYAILILEQSATTALLSSGVGVLTILFYFSRANENLPKH